MPITNEKIENQFQLTMPDGVVVHYEICLCCYWYDHPMRLKLSLEKNASNLGSVFLDRPRLPVKPAAAHLAVNQYLWENGVGELVKAANAASDSKAKFARGMQQEKAQRMAREDKENATMKAQGFTHRTVAWIHPKAGGDDRMALLFSVGKPTKADFAAVMKDSAIKTDYKTTAL